MLGCIDRAWRHHLAFCADVREGIHLVRLGGQDPLTRFTSEAIQAFSQMDDAIDEAVLAALAAVRIAGGQLDLTGTGLKAPSSTWTYLVNDDPFRNRIGAMLTGPGGVTVAIYSAMVMMPLLIAWGLVESLLRRGTRRRPDPFGKWNRNYHRSAREAWKQEAGSWKHITALPFATLKQAWLGSRASEL